MPMLELFRAPGNELLPHGYTKEDDAFTFLWSGWCYLNPVFTKPNLQRAAEKMVHDFFANPKAVFRFSLDVL